MRIHSFIPKMFVGIIVALGVALCISFTPAQAGQNNRRITGTVTIRAQADSVGEVDGRYRLRFGRVETRNDQEPHWGKSNFRIRGSNVIKKVFRATGLFGLRLDSVNPETRVATEFYQNNDFELRRGLRNDVVVDLVPDDGTTNPPPTGTFTSGFHINNVNLAAIYFVRLTKNVTGGESVTYAMRPASNPGSPTEFDPVTAGEAAEITPLIFGPGGWVPVSTATSYNIDLLAQDGLAVIKSLPNQSFVPGQVTTIGAASASKMFVRRAPMVIVDGVVINPKTVSVGVVQP